MSARGRKSLSPRQLVDLYRRMLLTRRVEEKIVQLYPQQEMRCPTHLSIGQEAVAAGLCAAMAKDDALFLGHRCHAGYLSKGGSVDRMLAELYGKKTGCARGWGGSMHLVDPQAGVMGTSSVLAGTIPIACGMAFSFVRSKSRRAAACMFGDAAIEEGAFIESVNMAALWKLPVVFVCENNGYSTATPLSKRQVPVPIYKRVGALGIPAVKLDGNDVVAVFKAAQAAIERARAGKGPTFLECTTYRWREHVGPNYDWDLGYRTRAEVESWMARDPIKKHERLLETSGVLTPSRRNAIQDDVARQVEKAVQFARTSPFPDADDLWLEAAPRG